MTVHPNQWVITALASLILCIARSVSVLAASAPMSISQLALYQGADREKILIEGAKKEGAFTLYGSHTWYRTMAKAFERNIRSSK